jgi:hypothetical protein
MQSWAEIMRQLAIEVWNPKVKAGELFDEDEA